MNDAGQADDLTLVDVIRFIARHWKMVVICLIAGLATAVLLPTKYTSTVFLFIPPEAKPEVKARLAVTGDYKRVLEAPETKCILQRKLFTNNSEARIDYALRVAISNLNGSVLEATVDATAPERAMQVANEWSTVFLSEVNNVIESATKDFTTALTQKKALLELRVLDLEKQRCAVEAEHVKAHETVYDRFNAERVVLDNQSEAELQVIKNAALDAQAVCDTELLKSLMPIQKIIAEKTLKLEALQKLYAAVSTLVALDGRHGQQESTATPTVLRPQGGGNEDSSPAPTAGRSPLTAVKNAQIQQMEYLETLNAEAESARAEKARLEIASQANARKIAGRFTMQEGLAKLQREFKLERLRRDITSAVEAIDKQFQQRSSVLENHLAEARKSLNESDFELQRVHSNENRGVHVQAATLAGTQRTGLSQAALAVLGIIGGVALAAGLGLAIELIPKARGRHT